MAKMEHNNPFMDSTKFERFLDLLPEKEMRRIINDLWVGDLWDDELGMFAVYEDYSANTTSAFIDPALNAAYKKFNKSFDEVKRFRIVRMFVVNGGPKLSIHPEMKYSDKPLSSEPNITEGHFWDKLLERITHPS